MSRVSQAVKRHEARTESPAGEAAPRGFGRRRNGKPRALKTSELISLEIVRDIVANKLREGDKLPIESDMLVQYGVGRSSLREALRLLEVQGLIEIRQGPGAPTVVGRAHPANLARTMTLYLHLLGVTYEELLEAWMLSEPMMAELAARNPDRERVRRVLGPACAPDQGGNPETGAMLSGSSFHDAVADLSGNRVLGMAYRGVAAIINEHILTTLLPEQIDYDTAREHRDLAEAIIAGNGELAKTLMTEHVRHVAEHFNEYWPKLVGQRIPIS